MMSEQFRIAGGGVWAWGKGNTSIFVCDPFLYLLMYVSVTMLLGRTRLQNICKQVYHTYRE